jgi:hypothetical protein
MASSPSAPTVSVIDAARDAFDHTRRQLFPFRLETWLVLGLLAFLDQCGRGGGGGIGRSSSHGSPWPHGPWPHDAGELSAALLRLSDWLSLHAAAVALAALGVLVTVGALLAVVLWLNARGTFMYLDDVASGRCDLSRPWHQHAEAAWSYFGWRFGLVLAAGFVVLLAGGLILGAVLAWTRGHLEGLGGALAGLSLFPVLLLLALAVPLLALAGVALRDFVAPLQLTTGLPCGSAARVLEGLLTEHPGAFLLYLLVKLVVVVTAGLVVVLGGCLTCCLGFLPIVMQTAFQPVFYFERALPVFLLRQMGHDLPGRLAASFSSPAQR